MKLITVLGIAIFLAGCANFQKATPDHLSPPPGIGAPAAAQ
ncbi:hypothetical protein [Labrys miyagiensis]|nr:hypothetical protein [Labrys miyagiensis]